MKANKPKEDLMAKATKTAARYVLVTTAHRGVFAGYLDGKPGKTVTLREARNCIYWPEANHGFLGLAADGPALGARVGPAAPELILCDVTSIALISDAARVRWEAGPWA